LREQVWRPYVDAVHSVKVIGVERTPDAGITIDRSDGASGRVVSDAGITIDGLGELFLTGHTLPVLDVSLIGVFQ
jgi:hypothetical protein